MLLLLELLDIDEMQIIPGKLVALPFLLATCLISNPASALSLTYIYKGSNFDTFDGTTGVFSTDDRVEATFAVDCSLVHTEGNCQNLPYDDYFVAGAISPESIQFSAGPAFLPAPDGDVIISRFMFSTDVTGNIRDWDIELFSEEPFQNIDTDNIGGGIDSAAALGGGANINDSPGSWENKTAVTEGDFDLTVEKRASNYEPADLQELIYFTILVKNQGPDVGRDIFLIDKLPPRLEIPEGLAAYPSVGYYDPVSGRWDVGELRATQVEELEIPVVITEYADVSCIVNTATADMPGDIDSSNNRATSVVHLPNRERCVDLIFYGYNESTVRCPDKTSSIRYGFVVRNSSEFTDPAREVVLEVTQTGFQAPGFKGESDNCDGLVCTWDLLESGEDRRVEFGSDFITVTEPVEHSIRVAVSSRNGDYAPEDNVGDIQITVNPPTTDCPAGGGFDFSGSGGGGCFIATAVYESESHPRVKQLQEFRDEVLMPNKWGRKFVDSYYRWSPTVADFLADRDVLRWIARLVLTVVVLAIAYPWLTALIFVALLVPFAARLLSDKSTTI